MKQPKLHHNLRLVTSIFPWSVYSCHVFSILEVLEGINVSGHCLEVISFAFICLRFLNHYLGIHNMQWEWIILATKAGRNNLISTSVANCIGTNMDQFESFDWHASLMNAWQWVSHSCALSVPYWWMSGVYNCHLCHGCLTEPELHTIIYGDSF